MEEFSSEFEENLVAIERARSELLAKLRGLSADRLDLARRGGWSVKQVLRHVIDSEVAYAKVIGFLRNRPTQLTNALDDDVASGEAAADALERVRRTTLSLLEGIGEEAFYALRELGTEQYSVVSVLENVASHDHEHLEQIAKILAGN